MHLFMYGQIQYRNLKPLQFLLSMGITILTNCSKASLFSTLVCTILQLNKLAPLPILDKNYLNNSRLFQKSKDSGGLDRASLPSLLNQVKQKYIFTQLFMCEINKGRKKKKTVKKNASEFLFQPHTHNQFTQVFLGPQLKIMTIISENYYFLQFSCSSATFTSGKDTADEIY